MPKPGDIVHLSATVEEAIHIQGDSYNLRLLTTDGSARWLNTDLIEAVGGHIFEVEGPETEETQETETPAEAQPEQPQSVSETAPEVPPLPEQPTQEEALQQEQPQETPPVVSEGIP